MWKGSPQAVGSSRPAAQQARHRGPSPTVQLAVGTTGGTHEQDRASWQRPQAGFRIRYMGHP